MASTIPPTPMTAPSLHPSLSSAALNVQFVGKHLANLPTPTAVLDAAVVRRNCNLMLDAASQLDVKFRAHVKTHKTTQIARLSVGETSKEVRLIGSTVSEVENLVPFLMECQAQGREVNVLYGLPVSKSAVPRLAAIARLLGEGSIGVFTDHPAQVDALDKIPQSDWPGRIPVWVNIDVGDHREGVPPGSEQLANLAHAISTSTRVRLAGLYTHFGSSYSSSSPNEALQFMARELEGLEQGAKSFLQTYRQSSSYSSDASKITLSLGATPTATSVQNLLEDTPGANQYRDMLTKIKATFDIELHAGVHGLMDMQQIATRARPEMSARNPQKSLLSYADLGFRVLVEVASLYPDRTDKPEALVGAGSIALGREPCKSYPGWAVVTPWPARSGAHYDPDGSRTGWIVGRISQEHGVLSWEGPTENMRQLKYGEKLMLWPNHACIAGANHGWFIVVDSDTDDPDIVRDVWVRWRGW